MVWNPATPGSTAQGDNQGTNMSAPVVLHASAARTATGNTANPGFDTAGAQTLGLELNVTAATGTTPSLTLSVEWSNDGTNWGPGDPVDVFTASTTVSRKFKHFSVKARFLRLVWTITGTTPSLTFTVTAQVQS